MDWRLALLALAGICVELPVNASKWSWALRMHGLHHPWTHLFRTSCFAFLFNNFLPTGIGGDVYRVMRTVPTEEGSRSVSAVLVERIVGFGVMLVNGALGAALLGGSSELARWYLRVGAGGAVLLIAGAAILAGGALDQLRSWLAELSWLAPVRANLRRIRGARSSWLPLIALSFCFQLLATTVIYLSFAAVGADIPVPAAALVAVAGGLAAVLPISISGIGVVEGSMAGTAVALGADYDTAVLGALLVRLLAVAVSAGCGLLYLTEPARRSRVKAAPSDSDDP